MSLLKEIQQTVQQVAEAITAVLQIETEIVDDTMTIIAGTGKYKHRIDSKEENGQIDGGYLYGRVIQNNLSYFVEDARNDPTYDPSVLEGVTEELAEICCPIHHNNKVIGVIGLVAFNDMQHRLLSSNKVSLLTFLQRMSELLSTKLAEQEASINWMKTSHKLETIIESIHECILAIDHQGIITTCNIACELLLQSKKIHIVGTPIEKIWPHSPLLEVSKTGKPMVEKEERFTYEDQTMHIIVTARPIMVGEKVHGVVASFRRMVDMRKLAYSLTGESKDLYLTEIQGESRSLTIVKKQAEQVARGSSNILITGESGTGKGMMAAAIHSASTRRKGPFIVVNCGAIPETLLESELFGYVGGAFTGAKKEGKAGKFELADGGTIFLDEIGDLPLHLQVKLLHVIQSKQVERVGSNQVVPVNIRLISATNKNLEEMVKQKEFREDLFFRLNVIPLHMPSLRERKEDIPFLMDYFLEKYKHTVESHIIGFTSEVREMFLHYSWPGNVRELENAIEYCINMEMSHYIRAESVPLRIRHACLSPSSDMETNLPAPLKEQLKNYERQILLEMIKTYGNSLEAKKKIAAHLEISLATLYRKVEEHQFLTNDKLFSM